MCVALGRDAGAWLTVASLLALFLGQPFHARAPIAPGKGLVAVAAGAVDPSDLPSQRAAHDAELCPQCRAAAQTRLGLRASAHEGLVAAQRPDLTLHLPAPAPPSSAPVLRGAHPRAPPTALLGPTS
jgi:hypothetical protein